MSQKLVRHKSEIRDLEIELEFICNKLEEVMIRHFQLKPPKRNFEEKWLE